MSTSRPALRPALRPAPRPALSPALTGAELRRWYWLRAELAAFARELGLSSTGAKSELTERIAAALDHAPPPAPPARPASVDEAREPLSGSTRLPPHQRCTQTMRRWFVAELGTGFRFDAAMRAYVAEGGHTLDEAVAHWRATRNAPPAPIGAQFELNRFSRGWYAEHPGSTHAEMLAGWRRHRSQPRADNADAAAGRGA